MMTLWGCGSSAAVMDVPVWHYRNDATWRCSSSTRAQAAHVHPEKERGDNDTMLNVSALALWADATVEAWKETEEEVQHLLDAPLQLRLTLMALRDQYATAEFKSAGSDALRVRLMAALIDALAIAHEMQEAGLLSGG